MDLLRVSSSKEITMHVPLHFINEETCPGKKAGGVVNHLLMDLEISCLPKDLPEFIAVDMAAIVKLARRHGLMVLEDCAQSHLASLKGKYLGTFGELGAWSTNESKHMKSGEGGFLLTDDRKLAVTIGDPSDVWIFDLVRNVSTRFTFDPADSTSPPFG